MRKYALYLALAVIITTSTAWHKFYVSITQLEYVSQDQEVQIITRLFYDDLEKALQERYDSSIKVEKSYDQEKLDQYINKYINAKMSVVINNKSQKLNYIGHKDENDYVVCFIQIKDVPEINSLEVENTLLMDAFTEQKNVVHTQIGNSHKSFMLSAGKEKAMLNISK